MKIGMYCLDLTTHNGIGRSVVELSKELSRIGHEVHCHCISSDARPPDVEVHKVRTINLVNTARLASFATLSMMSIKNQGYDITHSMGNALGSDVLTAQSCHKAGMRALGTRMGPADRFRLFVERSNYVRRRYHHVIAVARGVKDELIHHYGVPPGDISVIPNGVDLKEFSPSMKEVGFSIRAELGLSRDDVVAILVANEFDRKGLEYVIRAMPRIELNNFKVIVAGGDDSSRYLKLASDLSVADRIRFVGNVTNIAGYYAASDVFVFPSAYEAFSLATLEAAASGLPLITTRINGTEELVEEGVNGIFIERDAGSIAARLGDLLRDRDMRRRFSGNARKSAEGFSWESVARRTLEVYRDVTRMIAESKEVRHC